MRILAYKGEEQGKQGWAELGSGRSGSACGKVGAGSRSGSASGAKGLAGVQELATGRQPFSFFVLGYCRRKEH